MNERSCNMRGSRRGFTLVELLAVVTITAILALAGVVLFKRRLDASKGVEAISVIQAIRSAEEAYKAENHVYLNVSASENWYPRPPTTIRSAWLWSSHTDYARWKMLAPAVDAFVLYGYVVYAGTSGTTVPPLGLQQEPTFSNPMPLDWYVIRARGDVNGNSIFADYAASSLNGEVIVENEGE